MHDDVESFAWYHVAHDGIFYCSKRNQGTKLL